ncbi:MAG: CARDB domain-containing protein [Nitrospiraceae bacterium]
MWTSIKCPQETVRHAARRSYCRPLLGLTVWFALSPASAVADVGLIPTPTLQGVQVQAEAGFDSGTQQYTYAYIVSNPAINTGHIWYITVDLTTTVPRTSGTPAFDSSGLTIPIGPGLYPFDRELADLQPLGLPAGTTVVSFGQSVPPGWSGGLSRAGRASFGSGSKADRIAPGQTLSGFAVISRGMPTIRKMQLDPDWVLLVEGEATKEEEIAAREIERSIIFNTFTLGPSAHTPGTFAHWDQVRDDLNQAIQLGWISDGQLANTLVSQVASVRHALEAADGTLIKTQLDTLIQTITQSTSAQRRREVFDLVRLNAQRVRDATPDTPVPVPVEPKLKLAPQSSTLPLGARYTLTATVNNLGNPTKPPIEGFPLGFEVVEGPHVGKNSNSVTDPEGKLSFSYTGTQVGTDKISVGFFGEALLELDTAEVTWAGGPDLVVPLFAPPLLESEGGKTVFVTEWTSNLGSIASSPSITRYFISAEAQVDPTTAQVIGARAIPALAPGERSEGGTVTFTLPNDLPAGTYHLAACADAGTAVAELNEDNNCSFSKVKGFQTIIVAVEPEPVTNQPPLAQAGPDQTLECRSPSGATVTLDGTASSDPDSDPLSFRWTDSFGTAQGPTPQVTMALGTHPITLTVDDGQGGSASDTVAITVADTKPPTATAALTRLATEKKSDKRRGERGKEEDDEEDRRDRDDQNQFRVVAQAADQCDPHPAVQAAINGVAVTDGQVVRLSRDDDKKVRRKQGVLHIQAPNIVLTVSATDASGNRATAKAALGKNRREHDD